MQNKLSGVFFIGIVVLLMMTVGIGSASTLIVDDSGGQAYTSIQEAVNAAYEGDTILVYPGTYVENINVNKRNITIQSSSGNPEDTIVKAADSNGKVFNVTEDNVTINGFSISDFIIYGSGIYLENVNGCIIANNKVLISDYGYGIHLKTSNNNMLVDNTIEIKFLSGNSMAGIYLDSSENNTCSNNTISNCGIGLYVIYSSNNKLNDNSVISCNNGIYIWSSSNNTLDSNIVDGTFSSYDVGILLQQDCFNNKLRNNLMLNNQYNFVEEFGNEKYNDVDTSNLVDGKPIYYLVNDSDITLDSSSNAGVVYAINCKNIDIKDLRLQKNGYGIFLLNTSYSSLTNVTTLYNRNGGIYLRNSSNNVIAKSIASENSGPGISLNYHSNNNALIGNSANSNAGAGIDIYYSSNNTLDSNIANSDGYNGIYLWDYSNNNKLTNNSVSSNEYGIHLSDNGNSNNNILNYNTVDSNSKFGMYVTGSGNILDNNIVSNNGGWWYSCGLLLSGKNNKLTNNQMFGNNYNFYDAGNLDLINDVDTSNLVDGKPIYYLVNVSDITLDSSSNAGVVYAINCKNLVIKDLRLEQNSICISLLNTSYSTITNITTLNNIKGINLASSSYNMMTKNRVSGSEYGVALTDSSNNNLIIENTAFDNYDHTGGYSGGIGIYVPDCNNNTLSLNNVYSNQNGIILGTFSKDNTLSNNSVTNNGEGIRLGWASNNVVNNNIVSKNSYGIHLEGYNEYNTFSSNIVNSNSYGIILNTNGYNGNPKYNLFTNNNVSFNTYGIGISGGLETSENTFTSNKVIDNQEGIGIDANNNYIFNNYFCNPFVNARVTSTSVGNIWNTTKIPGTNIVGGPYMGGNFWATPNGTGFSQVCEDANRDGICDSSYQIYESNIDQLPLHLIDATGSAPELVPIGNKSVDENQLLTFIISATDADGDAITYSATGLPTGATLDGTTGVFSWTPENDQAGEHTVTFTATANGQTDDETIWIMVASAAGTTISYTPTYDNRLRQSSPNTVYSTNNYIDIGRLGTISYRDVMLFDLSSYKTTDTISKAILSLYWYYPAGATRTSDTVVEVYRPMQWDPQFVSWNNRMSGTPWTTPGGDWFDKNNVDHGTTPYASVTFPAGTVPDNKYYELDVTQLVQEYISGTYENTGFFLKAQTESGNYIAFYSSDWANAAQKPILTVTTGSSPVDNPPVLTAIGNKTVNVNSLLSFTISATDTDGDAISYSATGLPTGATLDGTTGAFSWTPENDQAGEHTVTFTATANGQTDDETIWIKVTSPDDTVSYTPTYDNRLREASPTTVISTSTYVDVGRSTTSYRDLMLFDLSSYKTTDTISKATLSLYWYYPAGATRTSDTVVEVYRPMQWNPQYVTWNTRMSGIPWTRPGGDWFDKNNVDHGTTPYASVTFPAGTVPGNKYYEFDVTQLVQEYVRGTYSNTGFFLKARTESGNYIAFYSSDWSNAAQKPKLTVTTGSSPADNPPVLAAIGNKTVNVNSLLSFTISATDADGDTITYSSTGLPTGATLDATTGVFSWTPGNDQEGEHTVTFTATANGQTDDETIWITVTSPGDTVSYKPTYDNRLRQSSPTTVYSTNNYIDIGRLGTTSYRDVMLFDLSSYKTTDTISKATLSLYWYYPAGATRTSDTVVEVYRPMQWNPQYVSWNNRMSGTPWNTPGGDWFDKSNVDHGTTPYASVTFPAGTVPDNKYYEFDVTQLVQEYVSGTYTNTGFFLKAQIESGNYIAFYSSDWANADQKPKLTVTQV